ncbi:MAG: hypothetical protein UD961_01265 [Bacteroidales bacterium]|nr:hypothetical protein [Bacteroidales bacterium]
MEKLCKYDVAGHLFEVSLPDSIDAGKYLAAYKPFIAESTGTPLFRLRVEYVDDLKTTHPGRPKECLNDEAPYFWIFDKEGRFNFGFSYSKSRPDCILVPSEDFSDSVVYIPSSMAERLTDFAISNSMMLLYTFRTSPFETLMVHASVIRHNDGGYMFLGRSGTGKSTHSRLWLSNIEDAELLNDDNPVIRIIDGEAMVFGTPWSGKTHCYKNESVPLKAVVRLSQAPYNKITRNIPLQAYASLMPACSCMRWDRTSTDALHRTVEKVISKVRCWHLECLPDADAAYTCHKAVTE